MLIAGVFCQRQAEHGRGRLPVAAACRRRFGRTIPIVALPESRGRSGCSVAFSSARGAGHGECPFSDCASTAAAGGAAFACRACCASLLLLHGEDAGCLVKGADPGQASVLFLRKTIWQRRIEPERSPHPFAGGQCLRTRSRCLFRLSGFPQRGFAAVWCCFESEGSRRYFVKYASGEPRQCQKEESARGGLRGRMVAGRGAGWIRTCS